MTVLVSIEEGVVRVRFASGAEWHASRPVWVRRSDEPDPLAVRRIPYAEVIGDENRFRGRASVEIDGAMIGVVDDWRVEGDGVHVHRDLTVRGSAPGVGLATGVGLVTASTGWREWMPFAPGAVYGDAAPVGRYFAGSAEQLSRPGALFLRADRLTAPVFAALGRVRSGLSVWDDAPDAATVLADGADRRGSPLVHGGIRVLSLGAETDATDIRVGAWMPAREGDVTYDAGQLPLGQHPGWRERFMPLDDGRGLSWSVGFATVDEIGWIPGVTSVMAQAWRRASPVVAAVPESSYLDAVAEVLLSQVRPDPRGRLGIGLESDPVAGRPVEGSDAALMGFVGANTDAALALLTAGAGDDSDRGARMRETGRLILDAFATLPVAPPAGEGFNLRTGEHACYRTLDRVAAVFVRSLAEGWDAALRAAELEGDRGRGWRAWAVAGGEWLLSQQNADGTFPRAWAAGTGAVLQNSTTATAHAVPFLTDLALIAGHPEAAEAAIAAGQASWDRAESGEGFAGGTLDNPDVVDKEAAVFALEAYLALAKLTGDNRWIGRAVTVARLAESWIQLWTPPMPADAADGDLHWKRGRSAVGMQGITTGVTMTDGFLAVNAAAFARLARATGDTHWADVAFLVFHGSKSMLATTADPLDLAGPGWQQEHWNLGPNRGFGLNRHWLPWAAVATLRGHQRLLATGDPGDRRIALGGA